MKKSNQLFRLKNIIINDRLELNAEFMKVFNMDLKRLLQQYFYIIGDHKIDLQKNNGGYTVNITFSSTEIKQFSNFPE